MPYIMWNFRLIVSILTEISSSQFILFGQMDYQTQTVKNLN